MLYRPSKLHNHSSRRIVISVALLMLATFFILVRPHMLLVVSNGAHLLASPFWNIRTSIQNLLQHRDEVTQTIEEMRARIQMLESELAAQRRENFAHRTAVFDVEQLRTLLGDTSNEAHLPATVRVDLRSDNLDMFLIDQGSMNGVRERMLVESVEGVAVGYVDRVYTYTASVLLFSSPSVSTNVRLLATPPVTSILSGAGAGTMVMEIVRDIQLEPGTLIALQNKNGSPIGEIVETSVSPEDAFQTVYVRSLVSQYELRHVRIDTSGVWEPALVEL